jgi:hypothetical protein
MLLVLLSPRSSSEQFGAGARPVHPILGCSRHNVARLAVAGFVERRADGAYDQDQARLKYLAHLRSPDRRSARSEAASEFSRAKTELIMLGIAEKQRELIPLDEAIETTDLIVGILLTKRSEMGASVMLDLQIRRDIDRVIF